MATVTLSVTAGGNTVGRTRTISAADLVRFITAYRAAFGGSLTDDAVILAWADGVLAAARTEVRRQEERADLATAAAGRTDIQLT